MAVADETAVAYCGTCEAWCAVQYSTLHILLREPGGVYIQTFIKSWQQIPNLTTHIHSLKYAIDVQTRKRLDQAVLVGCQVLANLNSSGDR